VSDLGVRNAIFRGAPSLWESDPQVLGPLVETLAQGVIRDHNLQVHFYREFEDPKDRRSRQHEVDFVAERLDGSVLPLEIKFRKTRGSIPLTSRGFGTSAASSAALWESSSRVT
jgi:uncharacterized protein (DUF924 family)